MLSGWWNKLRVRPSTSTADWTGIAAEAVYREGQKQTLLLLASQIFYQSVMASAVFLAAVYWESCICVSDRDRSNKLIRKAGSGLGFFWSPDWSLSVYLYRGWLFALWLLTQWTCCLFYLLTRAINYQHGNLFRCIHVLNIRQHEQLCPI